MTDRNIERPLVYVAGPITNDPWGCVRKALSVESLLNGFGIDCFLPQLSVLAEIIQHRPYEHYMRVGESVLERCDGLYRIRGDSPGTDKEVEFAESLGMPVWVERNGQDLDQWVLEVKWCLQDKNERGG